MPLAQYAATGCFNRTFYAAADEQLQRVLELCDAVGRSSWHRWRFTAGRNAYMKDMPALLCAWLSARDRRSLHETVFARVIDNAKMLRTYVQILRSGVVGRKSLGTAPKRLVRQWLAERDEESLFRSSVGQRPVVRRHREDGSPEAGRRAPRGVLWLHAGPSARCRRSCRRWSLQFERFKSGETAEMPDVPFQMLSALPLRGHGWAAIAVRASWQTTRMNLNTFARHGVFEEAGMAEIDGGALA